MKVFSKEKFIRVQGLPTNPYEWAWVNKCDGKPVVDDHCEGFTISPVWCIDVPDCKCAVKPREGQKGEKKMYTMQDFKDGKIAISIADRVQLRKLMKACHDMGLKWRAGEDALEYRVPIYAGGSIIVHTCIGLAVSEFERFRRRFKTLVVGIDEVQLSSRYRIVIECDGTTTTARMEINGREVKAAQARRNPADKFDWHIGAETAFGRLFGKKTKAKERPFRVGDRVVCVAEPDGLTIAAVGKHGRVLEADGEWVSVEFDTEIFGHDCLGKGRDGYCWNCFANTLRHE